MSTVAGAVAVYRRLAVASGKRRPPVRAVDRNLPMVVEAVTPEADGVVSLRLAPAAGGLLPRWRPGAHLDLGLPSGLVRQYSLCGHPDDRTHYRVAVRRIGEATAEVHSLREGTKLTVRGPRNAFPFVASERYQFVAGGIGITPILPMVRAAAAAGADWRLVYTGRDLASMPFLGELGELTGSGRVWIRPDTEYGIPASGAELLDGAPPGAPVYACGPIPMLTGIRLDAALDGHPVFFERFSTPPIVGGKPYRVALRRSGITVDVPADRSTLDVLRETLPGLAYSCRQGFCGTCEVPSVTGEGVRICVDRCEIALDL
ncbi:PDR/VanB family oxidoreductase [Amycolatopsis sp. CA-230715]|uniref:PDR/VanB family oxidoreductase n=1 Tax=Amycolatopsis sp. CA-230715 TaxID=2745196 RepID=UPI001C02FE9B|nr:oxidoreductase [Amycolatopsis sp. CA-230715]